MKTLLRSALTLACSLALAAAPAPLFAQHATDSYAPGVKAPEFTCTTWSGGALGSGSLVPCPSTGGGGGGGSLSAKANASAQTSTEGATTDPLSMDLSRNLRVIDSLVAGKLDTMIAGLSDTSPSFVKIDHTTPGTTDAVVVTSSALPTGGATAAKQPALGTAGTAATDVITVQGIAGGVAQPVSGTFWQATQPVSGTFWQATQPVSGTFWQATQPVSLASVPLGTNAAQETGGNLAGIATSASSIATNTALVASGATDSGGSTKPGCVFLTTMPTVTNSQRVDQQCTNHGEHIVAIGGASIQAAVTNISSDAQIGPNALATRSFGAIFNGAGSGWDRLKKPNLSCRIVSSAATTNLTTCKASGATDVFGYEAYNTTATIKVLKFYNKGSAPTVGTDTPTVTIVLPPTSRASFTWPSPLYSSLGLYIALTGAAADNDTTALALGDVVGVNVYIQ